MNNKQAIRKIRDFGLYHAINDLPYSILTVEAFKMAITALENEPVHCSECKYYQGVYGVESMVKSLPQQKSLGLQKGLLLCYL